MRPYPEHEFEMWARRRAARLGDSSDGGLFWRIYRQDRQIFEDALRERQRMDRAPAELTDFSEMLGLST